MRDDGRAMDSAALDDLIGRRIRLPGHFVEDVKLEDVRTLDGAVEIALHPSWLAQRDDPHRKSARLDAPARRATGHCKMRVNRAPCQAMGMASSASTAMV